MKAGHLTNTSIPDLIPGRAPLILVVTAGPKFLQSRSQEQTSSMKAKRHPSRLRKDDCALANPGGLELGRSHELSEGFPPDASWPFRAGHRMPPGISHYTLARSSSSWRRPGCGENHQPESACLNCEAHSVIISNTSPCKTQDDMQGRLSILRDKARLRGTSVAVLCAAFEHWLNGAKRSRIWIQSSSFFFFIVVVN